MCTALLGGFPLAWFEPKDSSQIRVNPPSSIVGRPCCWGRAMFLGQGHAASLHGFHSALVICCIIKCARFDGKQLGATQHKPVLSAAGLHKKLLLFMSPATPGPVCPAALPNLAPEAWWRRKLQMWFQIGTRSVLCIS